jgi:hypothetical protein
MPSSTSSPHSPPVSSTPSRPESQENHCLITYSWGYVNPIAWVLNRAITRHRSSPDHAGRSTRFDNYSLHSRPKVRQENWPKFATKAQTVFCEVNPNPKINGAELCSTLTRASRWLRSYAQPARRLPSPAKERARGILKHSSITHKPPAAQWQSPHLHAK